MKFFVLMLVSSSLMLSGCKKDEDEDDPVTPTYTNVLSAKVNGVAFSATIPIAQMAMGILQIGGSNAAGSMQIWLPYDVTPGTFTVTDNTDEEIFWSVGQDSYWPGTGTIVVTKHDVVNNIIEGTFTASLEEMESGANAEITNGVFKITYVEQ